MLAGTNKGCQADHRNFMIGAYFNLDVWVLNEKYSMVDAYAEYGYIGGVAQKNGIQFNAFGKNRYSQAFPDMPCVENTLNVLDIKPSKTFDYTVYVTILPITFSVGVTLGVKVTAPYHACIATSNASVGLMLVGSLSFFASAEASIMLAKGGIRLEAEVDQTLDPNAYLSISQCRIGFKATSTTSPFSAKFLGYVQTRDYWNWLEWGEESQYIFWEWQSNGMTKELFNYYYEV